MTLSADELAAIKARHHGTGYPADRCVACGYAVPCDAARLLAEIEQVRPVAVDLLEWTQQNWGPEGLIEVAEDLSKLVGFNWEKALEW